MADKVECNSTETSNLDNQQFRLNRINEIKGYFISEIRERGLMSKRLSKYIACCDYLYKFLIVFSAASGTISIASFATLIGTPVGIASTSLSLIFLLSTGLIKKLLGVARGKKGKHKKIGMLATSKLNSIEAKISEALVNIQTSHEDFMIIIDEEKKYRKFKESIRMMKGQKDKKVDTD